MRPPCPEGLEKEGRLEIGDVRPGSFPVRTAGFAEIIVKF